MDTEKRVGEAMAELPPELFEQTYVHTVYNKIATHFSDTRYKVTPLKLHSSAQSIILWTQLLTWGLFLALASS